MFLRFMKILIIIFLVFTILTFLIIIPVDAVGITNILEGVEKISWTKYAPPRSLYPNPDLCGHNLASWIRVIKTGSLPMWSWSMF